MIRPIAFYLPQYHPIPENDAWWGRGFTEWTNVAAARPLFPGHYQPHIPADLGFYDLRLPDTRQAQAELAREYGIHGFCYYHYWFNGRRLLNRPIDEVVSTGEPDFPFCLCWANENWTRAWDGLDREILMAQNYSNEDDRLHIRHLMNYFDDERYIRVDGKPLLLVYRTLRMPNPMNTAHVWREEAAKRGMELYLCRVESFPDERGDPASTGFDASVEFQPDWANLGRPMRSGVFWRLLRAAGLSSRVYGEQNIYDYATVAERMKNKPVPPYLRYPCVTPMWDNTARRKSGAAILRGSTPELYEGWLKDVAGGLNARSGGEGLLFINAWNEWAEGNHLEPCRKWGRAYLEATRRALAAASVR